MISLENVLGNIQACYYLLNSIVTYSSGKVTTSFHTDRIAKMSAERAVISDLHIDLFLPVHN